MTRSFQFLGVVVAVSTLVTAWALHNGADVTPFIDPLHNKSEPSRIASSTRAATTPSTRSARITLPPEFAIFQTRNAFAHGKAIPGAAPGGVEAGFVLRGVVQMGDKLIAFVEDKSAKRVTQLGAGEAIAQGKISAINLDGIDYQSAGPAKSIKVGQDFNGQIVPPTPTSKPAAPGAPQPGQEQPPGIEGQPGVPSDLPPGVRPGPRPRSAKQAG